MADQEFELTALLRIRTVTAKDAKDLQTYCFTDSSVEAIEDELKKDLERIKKDEVYRVVAEASGHAVGNIRLERSKVDESLGEIGQLSVSPPFRKFDVAARLVEVTEQIAQENKIKTLQIELSKSENTIITAYKKWGFDELPVVTMQKTVESPDQAAPDAEAPRLEESSESSADEGEQQKLL